MSHFFSSFFIEILTGPFHMKYEYNNICRWTRRFDIFALEKLFFPINLVAKSKDEIGHWTGVVIFVQIKLILYYDCGGGEGVKYKDIFLQWLVDEAWSKKQIHLDPKDWVYTHAFDFKRQRGGLDCGVFLSMDFNYLTDDLDISYSQNDISAFRLHMANAILRGSWSYN
jgi:sentrin-specific protease 1